MRRLFTYLKPHAATMAAATTLVLFIIAVELYRPIIIGDAIDEYINGYYVPYRACEADAPGAVSYGKISLARCNADEFEAGADDANAGGTDAGTGNGDVSGADADDARMENGGAGGGEAGADGGDYYQILLYKDRYYMAERLSAAECATLADASEKELRGAIRNGAAPLSRDELRELRRPDFSGILRAAGAYLLMLLLGFALNAIDTWLLQKMGQKIIYRMREEAFEHIHSLSMSFFNATPVGTLVTRVSNDTEAINELFSTILVKLFKNIVKILGYAAVMYAIDPRMAAFSFALLPVVAVLTFVFRFLSRRAYQITRTKITEMNAFLSEHLSGMRLIQIFAREREKYEEFEKKSGELFAANWREVMTFATFRPLIYLVSIIAMVLVIGAGSSSVLGGTLSLGTLFIFITYISSFFEPIQELAEQFGTLQSSLASAEKLFSILDAKPEVENPENPVPVRIRGRIEFSHVWFAYQKKEDGEYDYILRDVSFTIEPGQRVAFVGATGAGKTSILNLIGRYYDIQKGEILIDGVDIKKIDLAVLRGAIGQVQQDVFIFTGDVKNNISLRDESIGMDKIIEAAKIVNADSFIQKMPGGYDEPVTERGSTLSAGQRQLISFARTLARDPAILVLDEATANIDTETESLITDALEKLMEGRTTIMVAHRLSTIQHADKIIVMHHGKIQEEGTHQELLRQDGIYRKLYDLQLADA